MGAFAEMLLRHNVTVMRRGDGRSPLGSTDLRDTEIGLFLSIFPLVNSKDPSSVELLRFFLDIPHPCAI